MDPLMALWVFFIGLLIGCLIGVGLSYRKAVSPLQKKVDMAFFHSKDVEESMKYYPFDKANFRFIGNPVAGIQFDDDQILIVLYGKENPAWTNTQDRVKTLVENGKVRWFEF